MPLAHSWSRPRGVRPQGRLPGTCPGVFPGAHAAPLGRSPDLGGPGKCDKCPVVIVRAGIREYRKASVEGIEPSRRGFGIRSANHCSPTRHGRAKEKSRLVPDARLRRLLGGSPAGDHPGGPPAHGLSSAPSWWWKAYSSTDRRHADKAMVACRHAFLGFRSPYMISPGSVVLAGISLTHPPQGSQRISRSNSSQRYFLCVPTYYVIHRFPPLPRSNTNRHQATTLRRQPQLTEAPHAHAAAEPAPTSNRHRPQPLPCTVERAARPDCGCRDRTARRGSGPVRAGAR